MYNSDTHEIENLYIAPNKKGSQWIQTSGATRTVIRGQIDVFPPTFRRKTGGELLAETLGQK